MFVSHFYCAFCYWLFCFGRAQCAFCPIILFYFDGARRLKLFLINIGRVIGQFCAGARSNSFFGDSGQFWSRVLFLFCSSRFLAASLVSKTSWDLFDLLLYLRLE